VRPLGAVAGVALIAALATVAVPLTVNSRAPNRDEAIDAQAFTPVRVGAFGTEATALTSRESAARSAGLLDPYGELRDSTLLLSAPPPRLDGAQPPAVLAVPILQSHGARFTPTGPGWHWSQEESWYGPGFWDQHTACGQVLTRDLVGVAHRSLPCGTLVQFMNPKTGQTVTVPVIDRGPYVSGRLWDLTKAACTIIAHCYTGSLWWRLP
jgi:hypothetical protein